jgi:hypothetical protein
VAANVFRTGYNLRSYKNMNVFDYRNDNIQKLVQQVEHRIETHGVEFKVKFNINHIEFNSRLNENMISKMRQSNFHQDLVEVVVKDH